MKKKATFKAGDRQYMQRGSGHVSNIKAMNAAIKDIATDFEVLKGRNTTKAYIAYLRVNPETFCTQILNKPIILTLNF